MSFYRNYLVLLLLLLFYSHGFAQVFGGNPPSVKWKQVNTPLSKIIFPTGLDSTAERISNIIKFISGPTEKTIGTKVRKINLVVQNQTTVSNAYVGLGPFRSEFFITPLQNSFELGSLAWPDQLTIHEYRHVQQYNNFKVGLSKIMYDIFGDEGQSLANGASIPNWFFEGDAVFNETNLSNQGRGDLPFFYNGYRSLWKAKKQYSWMKLRNGSYKDFVPDHYALGFLMVAYGREKYGDQFWKNVTHDAASFKPLFYPFQHAIKKYSGKDYATFRNEAFNFFKKQFYFERDSSFILKQKVYTDEQYPSYVRNDSIIFVKSGYKQIPEFVLSVGNKERKLRIRDYSLDNQFSYKNGKIVYSSYRPDIRWGYRDYSDLQILDVSSGKQHTLTKHSKYFSPDISDDSKKIVAVNVPTDTKSNLHILDAFTGRIIKIISNPEHVFYTYPKFYNDKKIITPVRNREGKMSLAVVDIDRDETNYLLPFSYNVIGFPFIQNDTVYFSYSYLKNDELFAYTFANEKLWKLNSNNGYGLGKYQPSANQQNLVWSSFTFNGYKLQTTAKKNMHFEEINTEILNNKNARFGITSLQKLNANLLAAVPNDSFPTTKYFKSFRLFNFHSIEPKVNDPEYTLALVGENILNTFQSQLAFTYDRSEKFKRFGFNATYGGIFPLLSGGIDYTFDRRAFYKGNQIYFNELEPFAGFSIPLNFSKGRSFTFLSFGSRYVFNQSNFKGAYKDTLGKTSYSYSSNFLSFIHKIQKAQQQIFPSFAQTLFVSYKTPLSHYEGFQFLVNGSLYFPGLLKTHSILLNTAYLRRDSASQINFSSGFPFSRGYQSINLFQMSKWGVDYNFPICYPDAGFGNIFYMLRIRSNIFYDHTQGKDFRDNGNKFTASFRSLGAEIYFDTKWWNEAIVSIGIRYSHLLDDDLFGSSGRNRLEIILPVNIFDQ